MSGFNIQPVHNHILKLKLLLMLQMLEIHLYLIEKK